MNVSLEAWGYAAFAVEEAARQEAYAAEQAKKQDQAAPKRKVGDEMVCGNTADFNSVRYPVLHVLF